MGKRIMFIAGVASGDSHAAAVIQRLRERAPDIEIFGAGGPLMKSAGMELLIDLTEHAVGGLVEVLKHYLTFRRMFYSLVREAELRRPDVVVLVDFPGFNLRFARQMKKRGFKVVYYISPQLWAWHASRAKQIERDVALMMTIFPFEKDWYARHAPNLRVEFTDPHIIHVHELREDCGFVWVARPVTANRNIKKDIKGMVKYPIPRYIASGQGVVMAVVYKPAYLAWLPFHCKQVKIIGKFLTGQGEICPDAVIPEIAWPMNRTAHSIWSFSDVLQDVYFPTIRPTYYWNIISYHPESRPQTMPVRDLNACFNPAVFPGVQTLGLEAGRSVTVSHVTPGKRIGLRAIPLLET